MTYFFSLLQKRFYTNAPTVRRELATRKARHRTCDSGPHCHQP